MYHYTLIIIFLLFECTFTYNTNKFTIPQEQQIEGKSISKCVNLILAQSYSPENLIILWDNSEKKLQLNYPMALANFNENMHVMPYRRANWYIINTNYSELEAILVQLEKQTLFDSAAKFVIIIDKIDIKILKILLNYFIRNVVIIKRKTEKIYTYYPYFEENLHEANLNLHPMGQCMETVNFFPNKIPLSWQNTTLNISYLMYPPFITCIDCPENPGYEINLLDVVTEKLKFNIRYGQTSQNWGELKFNDSHRHYTSLLGEIEDHTIITAIGLFHPSINISRDFEITTAIFWDFLGWYLPQPRLLTPLSKMFLICSNTVWLFYLGSIAVTVLILRYILSHKKNSSFALVLLYTVKTITSHPSRISSQLFVKVVMMQFVVLYFVFNTVYVGKLVSFYTKNIYEKTPQSFEEIVQSDLKVGLLPGSLWHFNEEELRDIGSRLVLCNVTISAYCSQRMAFARDLTELRIESAMNYNIHMKYLDLTGRPLVRRLKKTLVPLSFHWYFNKGFPMFEQINRILLQLHSNGLADLFYKRIIVTLDLENGIAVEKSDIVHTALGLVHLEFVFVLLIFGLAMSIVSFIIEKFSDLNLN